MLVRQIEITEQEMNYTQFCFFSYEAFKDILSHILLEKDKYSYKYSKENFDHFMDEFRLSKLKYNLNSQELLRAYAPEFLGTSHQIVYNFDSRLMLIYDDEENIEKNI